MSISSLLNLKISNLKKKNDILESVGEDDGEPKSQPSSEKKLPTIMDHNDKEKFPIVY